MSLLLLGLYFYLHITTSKMTQLKILSTKIKTKWKQNSSGFLLFHIMQKNSNNVAILQLCHTASQDTI